jgi:hypothetical protein
MKQSYQGPAKPIRTGYFNPTGLLWRVILLVFLIGTLLMDLLVWRPG